ncbi:hypothetical protein B5F76_02465 [Desulfovibrio sp. An276]|uniref:FeoB-associated Cys-rich membrane protein n=1 Tax=Desulfovibrio sp. An276 TaxID=1965618 RepID=UPI000B3A5431|nr:FeoB-associated Cys-rich membrane protein [Desulfovibrio sp. An276]OUO54719.1 hypothetical protein B5F76_02465 [Desulfovibrio sp. An276]
MTTNFISSIDRGCRVWGHSIPAKDTFEVRIMSQDIIVGIIILLALVFLVRNFRKKFKSKSCDCCGSGSSCGCKATGKPVCHCNDK